MKKVITIEELDEGFKVTKEGYTTETSACKNLKEVIEKIKFYF